MPSTNDPYHSYRTAASALSLTTMGIASLVLIGWSFGIPVLTSVVPGLASMKVTTAFGFLCAATSVFMLNATRSENRFSRLPAQILTVPAAAAGLLGLGTLVGYEVGVEVQITHPAWMAPSTAASFVLLALAIFTFQSEKKAVQRFSESTVLLMVGISGLALVGYLYKAQSLYSFKPYGSMAVHTALSFVLIGVALLCVRPDRGVMAIVLSKEAGGLMLRRMIPLTLGMVIITGWVRFVGETMGWFDRSFSLMAAIGLSMGGFCIVLWIVARALNRAARERDDSRIRLQLAKEAAGLGIQDYDITHGTIQWDERVRELWNVEPDEPITVGTFWAGVHPDDQATTKAALDHALDPAGDGRHGAEFRVVHRTDGRTRWIEATGRVTFERGVAVRLVGTVQDITERKEAEAALRESEARFRNVFEHAATGIAIANLDGNFVQCNPAFCAMLGYTEDELRHVHFSKLVHAEDRGANVEKSLKLIAEEFSHYEIENRYVHKNGELVWVRKFISLARDHKRRAKYVLVLVTDITQRLNAEQALRAAQGRLQRWNQDLEQAVNVKTAELTQSEERLRALTTELNLAEQRERKRLATELHDHLQQMLVLGKLKLGAGKRLTVELPAVEKIMKETDDVFSDALTYTRTLVSELSPTVLHMHGLAAGLKWLGEHMKRHDQTVTVNVPDSEGRQLPEDQVLLLFQSARELLINSSKHAGTGEATVSMEHRDGNLSITVSDNGAGFDPAAVGTPSSSGISSRFGLFSVQERMKALGGSFTVQSAPGQGTTATLTLPLGGGAAARSEDSGLAPLSRSGLRTELSESDGSALKAQDSARQKDATVRVLLVDDHAMVRQGLRAVLDAYADLHVVGEAHDGAEAVKLAEELGPQVVVMDINMPRMNGIEATTQIKARWPETRVIGISVNTGDGNSAAMKRAGAAIVLPKDTAVDQLHDAISGVCQHPVSS
ncbi:MAG: PAS domain S-box protein [Nitrospira sp.]